MEQSLQFASFVQADFGNVAKRADRGVRQAGFLVLRKTSAPSVLIELGFINNNAEARFLSSKPGQQSMATAIYSGFRKYKRDFDKKQGKLVVESSDKEEDLTIDDSGIDNTAVAAEQEEASSPVVPPIPKAVTSVNEPKNEASSVKTAKDQIEYRVQFLISSKKLPDNSSEFKGLSPVTYYKDGNSYKYMYGSAADPDEIARINRRVREKFKDAFVVKFKNGKRIK
jgi:N-acetylmuramoyl-L-alanine amidase